MSHRQAREIFLTLAEGRELSEALSVHVRGCPECQEAMNAAARFDEDLRASVTIIRGADIPPGVIDAPGDRRRVTLRPGAGWLLGASAVAVLLSVGIAGYLAGPAPTPEVSPTPAANATDAPDALAAGDRGEVIGPDIFAAAQPEGDPMLHVEEGKGVSVIEVQHVGDDTWYLVEFFGPGGDLFGWIPSEVSGRPTVARQDPAECSEPSLGWLGTLDPADRLRCWGNQQIELEGYLIARELADTAYTGTPQWLADEAAYALTLAIGPAVNGPALPVHFPEGVDVPHLTDREGSIADGVRIRLTGQLDYPDSFGCDRSPTSTSYPDLTDELGVLWCRQQFVVSEAEPIDEPVAIPFMAGPFECVNESGGYAIPIPRGWWTNVGIDGFPGCTMLASREPDISAFPGQDIPTDQAEIIIAVHPTDIGFFEEPISVEEVVVGWHPGVALEWEFNAPDRAYQYVISLGTHAESGPTLTASAESSRAGGRYDENKAWLDVVMSGLRLVSPSGCELRPPAVLPDATLPGEPSIDVRDGIRYATWGFGSDRVTQAIGVIEIPPDRDLPADDPTWLSIDGARGAAVLHGDLTTRPYALVWTVDGCPYTLWVASGLTLDDARSYAAEAFPGG